MSLNVLLLAVQPGRSLANTLRDHISALTAESRHRVVLLQNYLALFGELARTTIPASFSLEKFDALVIHYSNYLAHPRHLDETARQRISQYRGLKVAFIQDEYRTVNATVACLQDLGIDVLFTCVPECEVEKVYPTEKLPRLRKISTLTGFVPKKLASMSVPHLDVRTIDLGYRARMVPFWLGQLGAEKWQIVPRFLAAAAGSDLRLDLSNREEDRIYGKRWIKFLLQCRAVLGVESGASVFDFTGDIQREVDAYQASHPSATFEEVQQKFLAPHEHKIRLNQISPRAFEAAALRTAMVLYEGEYSGILKPDIHYIELRKDFSNINEVVGQLKDLDYLKEIVNRTYQDVALNPLYSYREFVRMFDNVLDDEIARRNLMVRNRDGSLRLSLEMWLRHLKMSATPLRLQALFFLWRCLIVVWLRFPTALRDFVRPLVRRLLTQK